MRSVTATVKTVFAATAVLLALAMAGASQDAAAQTGDPLQVILTLKNVEVNSQGQEALTEATRVKPGDLVEYRAVYTNSGKVPMRQLTATLPIPEGLDYVANSARPAGALASADGKEFAPEPLKRTVEKDGKSVTEIIPASEYRFLRWEVKAIDPGKDFAARARAKVSQATAQPAPQQAEGAR
ncbi:MAG: hypothetical protein K0A93_11280 [Desulfuromonadaceae bacterium]|nr:hypothetical protein [Desulfuromonadaceae bacterium]